MRPGEIVDVATVTRNWWSFPAVGFNAILDVPINKFECFPPDNPPAIGSVVVPNSIFGLPPRKDLVYKAYWYHRRKLAGYNSTMQMFKWEWPGSNRKVRTQKKSGKGRMGRRKAPAKFDGSHVHALRPRDWGAQKFNLKAKWLCVKVMLSVKYMQGALHVVDSFNLQSHKTKHLVQHLRRLLGRRCRSAMLVHEGHQDINDNCRWASAHIPAVHRENVEGINVYNLMKYHEVVFTEVSLAKIIREIQGYPSKLKWGQQYATPDGMPAPIPEKVPGWNTAWVARKERLMNAEYRQKEFFHQQQKWKWSPEIKGPLKVLKTDPLAGFRIKDFLLEPERPVWAKLEDLYADDEPLDEEPEADEFDDLLESLEGGHQASSEETRSALISPNEDIEATSLQALQMKRAGGGSSSRGTAGEGEDDTDTANKK